MREVEVFACLFAGLTWILWLQKREKLQKIGRLIAFISLLIMILHGVVEGARWSLLPLYGVIVLGVMMGWREKRSRLTFAGMIGMLLLSAVLSVLFPVGQMPKPTGRYSIGTVTYDRIDKGRQEAYTEAVGDERKIKIQLWYPAETVEGLDLVPWLVEGRPVARALAKEMKLPTFALDQTALVKSHAYDSAPISTDELAYPVVIISHGWTGFRNLHSDLAEELASAGMIVIGIDHSYGSLITVFNHGEVVYNLPMALPSRAETPDFLSFAQRLVNTYAGDIIFVLDELEDYQAGALGPNFVGKFDLDRIGVLGHSTGGGAGVEVALMDSRVQAVMGMDAWVEPIEKSLVDKGLDIPALFLRSEQWENGENDGVLLPLLEESSGPITLLQVDGTFHLDFSMAYMYSPVTSELGITGPLNPKESAIIQRELARQFFERQLQESTSPWKIDQWEAVRKIYEEK
ncbi:carboxylic ester hydrolase [Gottschalkiaceae bacterium SANA]|nr:carboxylic ester hydrolase [Gottschalkiaceae bacterium SANA]